MRSSNQTDPGPSRAHRRRAAAVCACLVGLAVAAPATAQSIDVPALWQRYLDTCTPFATDVTAAMAALEPLAEGAEMSRSEGGHAMRYELGDEDGLVGNHIYINRTGSQSGVHCSVFDFQIGALDPVALTDAVTAVLTEALGAPPDGGLTALAAHPDTGLRVWEANDYWANLSASGDLPAPGIVTSAEIQREDYGGIFAVGVTFGFYATVSDAQ